MEAWIGLGSNLGEPRAQLTKALRRLQDTTGIKLKKTSGLYRSAPWGKQDQGDFLNAVAMVETDLPPHELLEVLLHIEQQMGRDRSTGLWGPRCIDLDLLTYENQVLESPGLELPHPRMHLRAFVLQPLLELDPDFTIAGKGKARELLCALEHEEVEYIGAIE